MLKIQGEVVLIFLGSPFCPLSWNSIQNVTTFLISEEDISMYSDDHQIFSSAMCTGIVEEKLLREGNKATK